MIIMLEASCASKNGVTVNLILYLSAKFCREGIEDEIAAMTQEFIRDNVVRKENDASVRHNRG